MELGIVKNQNVPYELFDHETPIGTKEPHYCRAMNEVLTCDHFYCENCPLHHGEETCPDSTVRVRCRYYDLKNDFFDSLSPEKKKAYTDGLIMAGITGEFPEYVYEDQGGCHIAAAEKAIRYAAVAHKGTYRKGSGLPYIAHPIEVMMLAAEMTDHPEVIVAAALHDVVEDTDCTLDDIALFFGDEVASLVHMESEDKREELPKNATWKIRKQENLIREQTAPLGAKIIMLADKISNMRATVRDFRINGSSIWKKFNMTDEKEQEWYYRSVAEVLSELSDYPHYREYTEMLDEVFG